MIKNNYGIIVNVNPSNGKSGFENLSVYCANKFSLMGLAKSIALEADPYNIQILTICPRQKNTKMWQDFDPAIMKQIIIKCSNPNKSQKKL